jgi:DtxR family Mn-dependent transcriptional regulator
VARPLSSWAAGGRGQVAALPTEPGVAGFLRTQGLAPGAAVEVLVVGGDGAVLLAVAGRQLTLAPAIAAQIAVTVPVEDHSTRREAWARCSAFWACPRSEECAAAPALYEAQ